MAVSVKRSIVLKLNFQGHIQGQQEKEKFKKKCLEKRSKIQTKCAHAPCASYNTP